MHVEPGALHDRDAGSGRRRAVRCRRRAGRRRCRLATASRRSVAWVTPVPGAARAGRRCPIVGDLGGVRPRPTCTGRSPSGLSRDWPRRRPPRRRSDARWRARPSRERTSSGCPARTIRVAVSPGSGIRPLASAASVSAATTGTSDLGAPPPRRRRRWPASRRCPGRRRRAGRAGAAAGAARRADAGCSQPLRREEQRPREGDGGQDRGLDSGSAPRRRSASASRLDRDVGGRAAATECCEAREDVRRRRPGRGARPAECGGNGRPLTRSPTGGTVTCAIRSPFPDHRASSELSLGTPDRARHAANAAKPCWNGRISERVVPADVVREADRRELRGDLELAEDRLHLGAHRRLRDHARCRRSRGRCAPRSGRPAPASREE